MKYSELKDEEVLEFENEEQRLKYIKDKISWHIKEGDIKPKVGDLLKIIEIQKKLGSDSGAEEKFWEEIEKIRREALDDD